jgi:anthranilate phosphoribosyltransferase
MAVASQKLGRKRVMAVHSHDGLDELSVCAPTAIVETDDKDGVREYVLNPEDMGITGCSPSDLTGGTPEDNADIALQLLAGGGPRTLRESVSLNAGAALYVAGSANSVAEGYKTAALALESGKTAEKLEEIRSTAMKLAGQTAEVSPA